MARSEKMSTLLLVLTMAFGPANQGSGETPLRVDFSFQKHWSFIPLQKVPLPTVEDNSRARNPLDLFVLARLEQEGLSLARQASRERLIRRLSSDLTGLPPTIDEIDAFLEDDSEDAYDSLVDRLLGMPGYGERMAIGWLDLARYSDTYGYQVDRDRFVWPWKDWVIKAFNNNLPYDKFVTWQLAGDLLPESRDEQILATAFNRLHPQKTEGGSVPEEFRVEYVADRNHTFATALLGLTLECARCHDHKYDPISQKEYYQLFAFFNNIDEAGLYSYSTNSVPTPTLLLMNDKLKAQIAGADERIIREERALDALAGRRLDAFRSWLDDRPSEPIVPGGVAHLDFEEHQGGANKSVDGKFGKAVKLTGDDGIGLDVGNFRRFDPFSVTLWMNTPDIKERAVVFHRSEASTDVGSRGYQLLIEGGKLSASLINFWPGNAIRVRTRDPIPTGQWLHVAVTYEGSSHARGLMVYVNGQPAPTVVVRDQLEKKITGGGGDNITIGARKRDRGFTNGLVDEFQVFDRQLTTIEVQQIHDGRSLAEAFVKPAALLSNDQRSKLLPYYLATVDPEYQKQRGVLRAARQERSETVNGVDEIMVMRELRSPRQTYVLKRGAYNAPGEPVSPGTPALLPPLLERPPKNRLDLARWLTDASNPLTARVAVNRFWQMIFGNGLVRTPEDFGSQGKVPTHPELLDWLAKDFMDHGWDIKRLLKAMVQSATYRQDSVASPELLARDPSNLLLARATRYQLPAEMIRDNALAASGLLLRRIGGPPVRPYEVAVSFKPVDRDKGEGLYRRSLYTYWKRTGPAPVMMILDASKRDVCVVRRERTSTPLQACVLLNGLQFVEAARVLGQRMIQKHHDDTDAVLEEIFRALTSRDPFATEKDVLSRLYDEQLRYFEQHVERAEQFLKTGDFPRDVDIPAPRLAAVGMVANTLMNFDECIMRR